MAGELALLGPYTDGRVLALFTARSRMEAVCALNRERLEAHGVVVLSQRHGESRQRLIEQFRDGNAVLYGLRSFWEGIDVPGDALSFVVMEKLPYPALMEPIARARMEDISQRSGRDFEQYLFPLMVIQFKQDFGRLLRDEHDRGAVIIYDRRISRKSYLPDLLGALPGYQDRDLIAERSRKALYRLIAERFPGLIATAAKADYLDSLPDLLPTQREDLIARLALPETIAEHEYAQWRPRILEAMQALSGYADFRTPEQEAALRAMLTGSDVIAVLPTSAGKSLCFQLLALLRSGLTLVCSPLIALMRDQIDKLAENGIELAAALMSGQSASEREEILARAQDGRLRLLYLAPERLRDPVVLTTLANAPIRQIVVDEDHCVALWGPSFRPDFLVLPQIYTHLAIRPPVAAFTATATPVITDAITAGLQLHTPMLVRATIDRPELLLYHSSDERIQRYFIDQSRPDTELLHALWQWFALQPPQWILDPQEACDRFDIDDLALRRAIYLLEQAGMIERGSDVTVRANMTLLGTWDALLWLAPARVADVLEQLRTVLPASDYARQEIVLADLAEATGRKPADIEAALITFAVAGGCLYRPWEKGYQIRRLVDTATPLPALGDDTVIAQEQKLEQMRAFVHGRECRWQVLRRYFGGDTGQPCGTCDRCAPKQAYPWSGLIERDVPDVSDILSLGTTLLEVVDWNERRAAERRGQFGALTLLRILRGDQYVLMRHTPPGPAFEARLAALRNCPYWGVCRTLRQSEAVLQAALDRLIDEGYVEQIAIAGADRTTYTTLQLTARGRQTLHYAERLNW